MFSHRPDLHQAQCRNAGKQPGRHRAPLRFDDGGVGWRFEFALNPLDDSVAHQDVAVQERAARTHGVDMGIIDEQGLAKDAGGPQRSRQQNGR